MCNAPAGQPQSVGFETTRLGGIRPNPDHPSQGPCPIGEVTERQPADHQDHDPLPEAGILEIETSSGIQLSNYVFSSAGIRTRAALARSESFDHMAIEETQGVIR
jgi:hypothetical protein